MGLGAVDSPVAWLFTRLDKRRARKEPAIDAKVLSFFPYNPTDPNLSPRLEDYLVLWSGLTIDEVNASLGRLRLARRIEQKDGGWRSC